MKFAQAMKLSREAQGLSQTELAKIIGTDSQYINAIERERRNPGRGMRRRIADALGDPHVHHIAYGWSL